jgi:hypothetical protein
MAPLLAAASDVGGCSAAAKCNTGAATGVVRGQEALPKQLNSCNVLPRHHCHVKVANCEETCYHQALCSSTRPCSPTSIGSAQHKRQSLQNFTILQTAHSMLLGSTDEHRISTRRAH